MNVSNKVTFHLQNVANLLPISKVSKMEEERTLAGAGKD